MREPCLIDSFIVGAGSWIIALPAQRGFQEDLRAEQDRLLERLADNTADTGLATYWSGMVEAWTDRWVWLGLAPVLAALAYHLVMLRTFSATVGKRSLGLRRVASVSGDERPSWSALLRRVLTQFGPGWIILPLGFATGSATAIAPPASPARSRGNCSTTCGQPATADVLSTTWSRAPTWSGPPDGQDAKPSPCSVIASRSRAIAIGPTPCMAASSAAERVLTCSSVLTPASRRALVAGAPMLRGNGVPCSRGARSRGVDRPASTTASPRGESR